MEPSGNAVTSYHVGVSLDRSDATAGKLVRAVREFAGIPPPAARVGATGTYTLPPAPARQVQLLMRRYSRLAVGGTGGRGSRPCVQFQIECPAGRTDSTKWWQTTQTSLQPVRAVRAATAQCGEALERAARQGRAEWLKPLARCRPYQSRRM